jgi:hypothetical protein
MWPELDLDAPCERSADSYASRVLRHSLPNDYHRVVMVVPIVVMRIVVVPMAAVVVVIIIRLRESGRRKEHDQG